MRFQHSYTEYARPFLFPVFLLLRVAWTIWHLLFPHPRGPSVLRFCFHTRRYMSNLRGFLFLHFLSLEATATRNTLRMRIQHCDWPAWHGLAHVWPALISLPANQRCQFAAAHTRGDVDAGVCTPSEITSESTSESQRSQGYCSASFLGKIAR